MLCSMSCLRLIKLWHVFVLSIYDWKCLILYCYCKYIMACFCTKTRWLITVWLNIFAKSRTGIQVFQAFQPFGRMGISAKRAYGRSSHSAIQASSHLVILILQPFVHTGNPAIWPFENKGISGRLISRITTMDWIQ